MKRPMLSDKVICKNGSVVEIDSIDFAQPEEPRYFHVTDAGGADRRIQWRGGLWEEAAKCAPAEIAPTVPAPAPFPERELTAKDVKLTPYALSLLQGIEMSEKLGYRLITGGKNLSAKKSAKAGKQRPANVDFYA